jgi:SAM-dependent methyltransferase
VISRLEKVAGFYDEVWTRYRQDPAAAAQHLADVLPSDLVRGRVALDGGCGRGSFAAALAGAGAKFVVGLDISIGALRAAAAENAANRIAFVRGSMERLPFCDGQFGVVWAWGSIEHTADPWAALAELDRVLAPGGVMLAALYRRTLLSPIHGAVRAAMSSLPARTHAPVSRAIAFLIAPLIRSFRRREKMRGGESLAGIVHDWFFVPLRRHFDPAEVRAWFFRRGYVEELFVPATGRFDSSSHFIVRMRKKAPAG